MPSDAVPRGLFLDLDGTLADTLTVLRNAYADFLEQYGKVADDAEFHRLNGPPLRDVVEALRSAHRLRPPVEELLEQYVALLAVSHATAPAISGARAVLERARDTGRTVAVVTSGDRRAANAWLVRQGFADLVSVVVGGDEVSHGKPNPEPYLLALNRTGCSAPNSLAVEDSELGALAAIGAGIPTMVVRVEATRRLESSSLFLRRLPELDALVEHL